MNQKLNPIIRNGILKRRVYLLLLMPINLSIPYIKGWTTNRETIDNLRVNEKALTVHGTVTDSEGKALAGVNINIKGDSRGAVTDKKESFRCLTFRITQHLFFRM